MTAPVDVEKVRAALLDPAWRSGTTLARSPCTIAKINLVLIGKLTALDPAGYMCPVIRVWVIYIQDAMPDEIRWSTRWRHAAVGIAGSRSTDAVERARLTLLAERERAFMAHPTVVAAVPEHARPPYDRMLAAVAARPVADLVDFFEDRRVEAAGIADDTADAVADAYGVDGWALYDPAQVLTDLLAITETSTA